MSKKRIQYQIDGFANFSQIVTEVQKLQKSFKNIGLSRKDNYQITDNIEAIQSKVLKLRDRITKGFKSSREIGAFANEMQDVSNVFKELQSQVLKIKVDDSELKGTSKELQELEREKSKLQEKLSTAQSKRVVVGSNYTENLGKTGSLFKSTRKDMTAAAKTGNLNLLESLRTNYTSSIQKGGFSEEEQRSATNAMNVLYEQLKNKGLEVKKVQEEINALNIKIAQQQQIDGVKVRVNLDAVINKLNNTQKEFEELGKSAEQSWQSSIRQEEAQREVTAFTLRLKQLTSFTSVIFLLRNAFSQAAKEIRELDTAFNEISIVSGKTMDEMWDSFSSVNHMAQQFGVTTQGVVEVQNMYYHQGLKTADVNRLTAETLTLAKISGLDYADATDKMTAAMNAFQISSDNVGEITDTFAALASSAATSVEELANAMTKTASIAASAGMNIDTTSVFLTKMIETTRESSENLGTALKTVTARFTELKENIDIDEDGVIADFNKVDTALKSAGVQLVDSAGQFRDLDDVFMDLSKVWDTLDRNTQRYIATQAAGSRQQSRFIAMIEDYDRTLELTEIAQNSAGTGTQQLERSQISLETTINKIKGSWQELYTTWIKSNFIRSVLNSVNSLLKQLNKLSGFGKTLAVIGAGFGVKLGVNLANEAIESLTKTIVGKKDKIKKALKEANKAAIKQNWARGGFGQLLGTEVHNQKKTSLQIPVKLNLDKNTAEEIQKQVAEVQIYTRELQDLEKAGPDVEGYEDKKKNLEDQINTHKQVINAKLIEADVDKKLTEAQREKIIQDGIENGTKEANTNITNKNVSAQIKENLIKNLQTAGLEVYNGKQLQDCTLKELLIAETKRLTIEQIKNKTIMAATNPVYLALMAIIVALTAAYVAYKIVVKAQKKEVEKTANAVKNSTEAYEGLTDKLTELKTLTTDYNRALELQQKGALRTNEENEEYNNLIKSISENYPQLITYINSETGEIDKNTDAYERLVEAKKEAANIDIETGYNAITLFSEGVDIDSDSLRKTLENLKEETAKVYTEVLNATQNDTYNAFVESLTKKDISENQIKDALMQQQTSGFSLETINSLLGEQLSADQMGVILEQINKGKALDSKAFYETLDLNKDAAQALQKWYSTFKVQIDDQVKDLFDKTGDTTIAVAKIKNQQLASVTAMGLGENLTTSLSSIITNTLNADQSEIENLVNEYYKNLSETQQTALDKFFSDFQEVTPNEWDNNAEAQAEIILSQMGFSEESINLIIESLHNKQEELKKAAINFWNELGYDDTTAVQKAGQYTTAQINAFKTAYASLEKSLDEEGRKNFIESLDDYISSFGGNLTEDQLKDLYSIDWMDTQSISSFAASLNKANPSYEQFLNLVSKSGRMADKNIGVLDERIETIKGEIESLTDTLDTFGEAIQGEADFEGMYDLIKASKGGLDFTDFKVTANGFEVAEDKISSLKDAIIENKKAQIEETKATLQQVRADKLAELATYSLDKAKLESAAQKEKDADKLTALNLQIEAIVIKSNLASASLKSLEESFSDLIKQEQALSAEEKYLDLYAQKVVLEAQAEKASKLADKLKDVYDRLKDIADLLEDFDKWEDIENLEDILDFNLSNYENTIDLNVNLDINKNAIKKQVKTLNKYIATERAKQSAVQSDLSYWGKQAEASGYWTIGEDGNIQKTQKYLDLYNQTMKASTSEEIEAYQNRIDYAKKFGEKYKEVYEKYQDATEKEIELLSQLNQIQQEAISQMSDLSDTLLNIMIDNDQKELDNYQKMVDKKEEVLDDYLSAVQNAIDKERNMRDMADKEEELRQKERKLSILQMDTSGVYAGDIASLQDEISQSRQDLEDSYVDKYIDDLTAKIDKQKEAYQNDITAWEEYLEWKKEDMVLYQDEIDGLITAGADAITQYINTKSTEITGMTTQQLENFHLETEQTVNAALGYYQALAEDGIGETFNALEQAADGTKTLEEYTNSFAEKANTEYETLNGNIQNVSESIADLVKGLNGGENSLANAWQAAANAAEKYNTAAAQASGLKNQADNLPSYSIPNTTNTGGGVAPNSNSSNTQKGPQKGYSVSNYLKTAESTITLGEEQQTIDGLFKEGTFKGYRAFKMGTNSIIVTAPKNVDFSPALNKWFLNKNSKYFQMTIDSFNKNKSDLPNYLKSYGVTQAFKNGGYVNYTGPAWVDGTPTKPEAFLNADDTARFSKFIQLLQNESITKPVQTFENSSTNTSNTFQISISVDELNDQYDVKQLSQDIQNEIYTIMTKQGVTQA